MTEQIDYRPFPESSVDEKGDIRAIPKHVYIIFWLDDEYGHMDIKGVFDSYDNLVRFGIPKLQKREDKWLSSLGLPVYTISNYDEEAAKLGESETLTGDRLFWKKIEMNSLLST